MSANRIESTPPHSDTIVSTNFYTIDVHSCRVNPLRRRVSVSDRGSNEVCREYTDMLVDRLIHLGNSIATVDHKRSDPI